MRLFNDTKNENTHAHESDFDHAKMQITRNILPIRPVRLDMGHQAIITLKLDRFGLYL